MKTKPYAKRTFSTATVTTHHTFSPEVQRAIEGVTYIAKHMQSEDDTSEVKIKTINKLERDIKFLDSLKINIHTISHFAD